MIISEIILIDDGSTDGSAQLCDMIAAQYSTDPCTIHVIHQENRGVSAARNAGLLSASGSFILFVDSDDTVDARKLADLMQNIARIGSVDMAVFGISFDYYSAEERMYRQETQIPPVSGLRSFDECCAFLFRLFCGNALSSLCNRLIRKHVLDESGIQLREDMFLYEDLEFSLRIFAQCDTLFFCQEPIYHYRQASDEGNSQRRLKRVAHIPEVLGKIEAALVPLGDGTDILLSLHLVLAREKISGASKAEARVVCSDFREWINIHGLQQQITGKQYAELLYHQKVLRLLLRREKARIRHRLANWVKRYIGDFRKWKFRS